MFDKIARHFRNIGRQEEQKNADAIETFKVSPFTGGKGLLKIHGDTFTHHTGMCPVVMMA